MNVASETMFLNSRNKDEVATKPPKQADKQKADNFLLGLSRLKKIGSGQVRPKIFAASGVIGTPRCPVVEHLKK